MFGKKRLYKIVYERLCKHTMLIDAKDEVQAVRKFYKKTKK